MFHVEINSFSNIDSEWISLMKSTGISGETSKADKQDQFYYNISSSWNILGISMTNMGGLKQNMKPMYQTHDVCLAYSILLNVNE